MPCYGLCVGKDSFASCSTWRNRMAENYAKMRIHPAVIIYTECGGHQKFIEEQLP